MNLMKNKVIDVANIVYDMGLIIGTVIWLAAIAWLVIWFVLVVFGVMEGTANGT
jgi:hypothetical protein